MPVLPSSKPNDSNPQTPGDGLAETTAGNWPPRDRDPFDPVCEPAKTHEQGRESESPTPDKKE